MDSKEAIQLIKTRIPIADYIRRYIELRHKGGSLVAPCPFHQEKTPSFHVNEDRGSFYCFGCQATGDIFEFSMRVNGYDFKEALHNFAEELGISLSYNRNSTEDKKAQIQRKLKSDGIKMHQLAAAHFKANLKKQEANICNNYIKERGLSDEICEKFSLGYSLDSWQDLANHLSKAGFREQDSIECNLLSQSKNTSRAYDRFRNRLMFPIYSLTGQVVAFGGRYIPQENPQQNQQAAPSQEAKYINSSDTIVYKKGDHLYGLYQARKAIGLNHTVLLTEGYMDVITLHQFGFENAVGVLGTSLTQMQVKRISGFCNKAELLFDGDNAGRNAAFRSAQMLLLAGLECKVILFPEKEDIDSLLRQDHGLANFATLREKAEDGLSFLIRFKKAQSLKEAIVWAKEFLKSVQLPEIINRYASQIANELGIDEAEIRLQVRKSTKNLTATTNSQHTETKTFFDKNTAHTQSKSVNNSDFFQEKDLQRDRLILTFAVRYIESIPKLQELGVDFILKSTFAKDFWEILSQNMSESVFNLLNSQQKSFWLQCKEGSAPPCNDEEGEFFAIKTLVENYQLQAQKLSISAALRQGKPDLETQDEYLSAYLEEIKATHKAHKNTKSHS